MKPTEGQINTLVSLMDRAGIDVDSSSPLWDDRAAVSSAIDKLMPRVSREVEDPHATVDAVLHARARSSAA